MYKWADLTVNRLALTFTLPRRHLLGNPAFKAGTAKHARRTSAVERKSVWMVDTGTHTAQSAELLTTFSSVGLMLWIMTYF